MNNLFQKLESFFSCNEVWRKTQPPSDKSGEDVQEELKSPTVYKLLEDQFESTVEPVSVLNRNTTAPTC